MCYRRKDLEDYADEVRTDTLRSLIALRGHLAKVRLDALIVTNPDNVKYLSGFTGGHHSYLLVSQDQEATVLFTRSTEYYQALEEASGCTVHQVKMGWEEASLAKEILSRKFSRVGYEPDSLTCHAYERIVEHLDGMVELVPAQDLATELRTIKNVVEIEFIRQACRIYDRVLETVVPGLRPGLSELEICWELERQAIAEGAEGFWFSSIVLSGPRSALPHGAPSKRKLGPGDFLKIDLGPIYRGYPSDATRTVAMGPIDREQQRVYKVVQEAQLLSIEEVREGATCDAVHQAAAQYIEKAGYGKFFNHPVGHGVGGPPLVGAEIDRCLERDMIITIEPGIYIPEWGGVRIEDTVRVTPGGCEVLHFYTKELVVLQGNR